MKRLDLSHSRLSHAGIQRVCAFPNLEELTLFGIDIDDDDIAFVCQCRRLKKLGLSSPRITDCGLRRIADLGDLRTLRLSRAAITDEAVAALADLTRLERLNLSGTNIGPRGLDSLVRRAQRLREVTVSEEQFRSSESAKQLGRWNPTLYVRLQP